MQRLRVLAAEDDVRDITRHLHRVTMTEACPITARRRRSTDAGVRPQKICLEGRMVVLEPLDPAKHTPALWERCGRPNMTVYGAISLTGRSGIAPSSRPPWQRKPLPKIRDSSLSSMHIAKCGGLCLLYADSSRAPLYRGGRILFAPPLQRTAGATEAMRLMARHVFEDLRYRRYEWNATR